MATKSCLLKSHSPRADDAASKSLSDHYEGKESMSPLFTGGILFTPALLNVD